MRVLLAFLAAAAPVCAQPGPRDLLDAYERQLKALHDAAGPAVVCVVVSRSDKYPAPPTLPDYPGRLGRFDADAFRKAAPGRVALAHTLDLADPGSITSHDSATGVVIDAAGLVLTNFHTVEGATRVFVHLPGGKGSYADIFAADGRSDFAVLKLLDPPAGLKAVKFGTVRLHDPPTVFPGKLVAVFDCRAAAGLVADRPTLTIPAVTEVRFPSWNPFGKQEAPQSVYRYGPLLEMESRAVPSVSGAAVLNLDGELLAMTSSVAAVGGGDGGRTYAVPFDASNRRVVETLTRGEEVEYGFLGIQPDNTERGGVGISVVVPRSPVEGRLFAGDVILKVNGQPTKTFPDLLYHVGSAQAGSTVTMTVRSAGQLRTVETTLAKYSHNSPTIYANRPAAVFGLRVDWASVSAQGGFGAQPIPPGVVVRELVPESPAATKFKALGDNARWVVTQVNGTPTPTPAAFAAAARNQESVRLTVLNVADRNPTPRTVTLP